MGTFNNLFETIWEHSIIILNHMGKFINLFEPYGNIQ